MPENPQVTLNRERQMQRDGNVPSGQEIRAGEHAAEDHGEKDIAELREQIKGMLQRE